MSPESGKSLRILVVDDDEVDRLRIERFLRQVPETSFELETATTVATGIEAIRSRSFDCVLLDYRLPDGNAIDLLDAVEAPRGLSPPIVVQTVNDSESAAVDAVAHGAQDYLVKGSFDRVLLYRSIRYAIERDRLAREKSRLLAELQDAMARIRKLEGILPICAHCKRIRDESGKWTQVERYISERSEAAFSHGVCPDCAREYYHEYLDKA